MQWPCPKMAHQDRADNRDNSARDPRLPRSSGLPMANSRGVRSLIIHLSPESLLGVPRSSQSRDRSRVLAGQAMLLRALHRAVRRPCARSRRISFAREI